MVACRTTSPTPQATPDRTADATAAASGSALQSPTVLARMKRHEKHGDAMRDAVASGDLDEAKREAKILAELRIEGPTDLAWKERLDAMNAAAARIASSRDVTEASRDVALVARTCGDCHTMLGRPRPSVGQLTRQASAARPVMKRHQWAAAQLWDGLIIPSDDAWKAGAHVLSESPLAPEVLTPGQTPVPKIGALTQSVHDLGRRAETLEQVDARVELYGEALATCAECHQWLGGGPHFEKVP
jgi:mono/diheme cytochrome c family protein